MNNIHSVLATMLCEMNSQIFNRFTATRGSPEGKTARDALRRCDETVFPGRRVQTTKYFSYAFTRVRIITTTAENERYFSHRRG